MTAAMQGSATTRKQTGVPRRLEHGKIGKSQNLEKKDRVSVLVHQVGYTSFVCVTTHKPPPPPILFCSHHRPLHRYLNLPVGPNLLQGGTGGGVSARMKSSVAALLQDVGANSAANKGLKANSSLLLHRSKNTVPTQSLFDFL